MNINNKLDYIELYLNEDGNLCGRIRFTFYNEFTSKQANISNNIRAIMVDKAIGGGHGPRMKVYENQSHGRNKPCISLHVDNGIVYNDGNNPKDIKMDSKEFNMYKNICLRNWNLMCYCFNNNIPMDKYMLYDEQRRNDLNNPINIVRDKNDGAYRYTEIRYDGKYGAPVMHKMVEYLGEQPIEEN